MTWLDRELGAPHDHAAGRRTFAARAGRLFVASALLLTACAQQGVEDSDDAFMESSEPAERDVSGDEGGDEDEDAQEERDAGRVSTDSGARRSGAQDAGVANDARAPLGEGPDDAAAGLAADARTPDARATDDRPRDASVADARSADASGAGETPAPSEDDSRGDLGEGDGSDVITIGDSWMRLIFSGIETGLVKASGQPYRTYGVPATRLLDGVIPGQYTSAKRWDPEIKTVVMTAGGNDVIQSTLIEADCRAGGDLCEQQLQSIRDALAALWAEMSADGVQDVIHVMYSVAAASGVRNREAHNVKLAETCAAVPPPLRCHLLNTDELIGPFDLRLDGIHPDDAGYDRIGQAVYDLMVERGMRR